MIYQFVKVVVVPGKMAEYFKLAEEIQPVYPKIGVKIAASFHGYTGDMNSIYILYAFDDLAAYHKSIEARNKNTDYQKIMSRVSPLITSMTSNFLESNPWSPMK